MLPGISNQKYAGGGTKPGKEFRIWLVLARLDSSTK
jgi:hypothetical protein